MKKVLVTGAFGQIGSDLVPALQKKYGKGDVVAVGHKNIPKDFEGLLEIAETRDRKKIESLIKKYNIGEVYHLVGLLSAVGENDPDLTWEVNMYGLKHILDLSRVYKYKIFWPSSIAAFGYTTPKEDTPQHTILEPTTMYGVNKVAGELLCQYYFLKYGVDVRSVRYPGVISWKTAPTAGTSDYATAVFYNGLRKGSYESYVEGRTMIPMMYMDDVIKATLMIMEAPASKIKVRTSYNIAALSFTAEDLYKEVRKHIPNLKISYKIDHRQKIADSWPSSLDDSEARKDWGWKPDVNLKNLVEDMIKNLKVKFGMR